MKYDTPDKIIIMFFWTVGYLSMFLGETNLMLGSLLSAIMFVIILRN